MIYLELFWVCFRTSLVSFGGVHGALPEWQRVFVDERAWVTSAQLMESYVVGQLAPGPSMAVAILLGERVAGVPGACAAFLGTYTPAVLLAFAIAGVLRRAQQVDWIRRVEVALRPLVVGFMAAASIGIVRAQLNGSAVAAFATCAVAALVHMLGLLRPVPLMLGAGALCWLLGLIGVH